LAKGCCTTGIVDAAALAHKVSNATVDNIFMQTVPKSLWIGQTDEDFGGGINPILSQFTSRHCAAKAAGQATNRRA
jgi:hypothetical protein